MNKFRLGVTALMTSVASMGAASPAFADPVQKTIVTYDCGSAGTFQIEGLPNDATALQIVDSDIYHTFVGHEWSVFDASGHLVSFFDDGAQGRLAPLYTCTGSSDGYTIVVLAQLA